MIAPLPPGPPPRHAARATIDDLGAFRDRIDVRAPAEDADEHMPGAANQPELDERAARRRLDQPGT